MSLWSPAARRAYTQRQPPASAPRPEQPPRPALQKAALKPPPPSLARNQDSFTPAPPRGGPAQGPVLNPQPPVREGHSEPIRPHEVAEGHTGGTGVLTFNTANGFKSGDYRTPEAREAQAELIRQTGASIVGFQEVDVQVNRSGNTNTALDVVSRLNSHFSVFKDGTLTPVDIHAPAPDTAIRTGADGTTLYQTPEGTLVTGESFSADEREIRKGPDDPNPDTGADATYGNAIYVAPPQRVSEAYTVVLPSRADTATGEGPDGELVVGTPAGKLAGLADGPLTAEERDALGADNERLRDHPNSSEPRTALVTRVTNPDGTEQSIINVHLSADNEDPKLREAQLKYVADLVAAESKGTPAREVVLMGDFNAPVSEVKPFLEAAGLERVVGGTSDDGANIDQVWTTAGVDTRNSAQVSTDVTYDSPTDGRRGDVTVSTSDHTYVGYTEIS